MFLGVCSSFSWLFTGLDDVSGCVERMEQSSSHAAPHTFETTETSGGETEGSELRIRIRSKRTYKMKKVWGRMSWAASLWLGQRKHSGNPVNFTAEFAGKTCLSWHIGYTRSCATTREQNNFKDINVFFWKLRVGECLILKATPWEKK